VTYIVESLFDSRSGDFDSASGNFDDPFLPQGSLNCAMSAEAASVQAWMPAAAALLNLAMTSATSGVTAAPTPRTSNLNLTFSGSAVQSHELVFGTQGTFVDNDPVAPAPFADLDP
jgi:hypothetical protein